MQTLFNPALLSKIHRGLKLSGWGTDEQSICVDVTEEHTGIEKSRMTIQSTTTHGEGLTLKCDPIMYLLVWSKAKTLTLKVIYRL